MYSDLISLIDSNCGVVDIDFAVSDSGFDLLIFIYLFIKDSLIIGTVK